LNFYMNNIERFHNDVIELFPLDLPLPFIPGDCVRPLWQTDTDKMYVIIDKYDDDHRYGGEINSFVVYTDGHIEGPVKFTDDMIEYELYDYEFVESKSCPETARILQRCINREQNYYKITLKDAVEALNDQREFILELVQKAKNKI